MTEEKEPARRRKRPTQGQNVKIYARVRSLMPWEPRQVSLEVRGKKIRNNYGKKTNEYTFQNTYDPEVTNEDIFKSMVRPMIENVLDGFNAILIAYGQTGSGKTYSMLGKPNLNIVGLLPQMLGYLLEQPQVRAVHLSAVEAFGHHVARIELYDLFDPRNQTQIWTDKTGNSSLDSSRAIKIAVTSYDDALAKIEYAHHGSHFAPTGKNPESSRGHVTFVAKVTADHPTMEHADLVSYFIMVDCAGSEGESAFTPEFVAQIDKTTLMARRLEAGVINTGLSQLQIIFNELRFKGSLSNMIGNGLRRVLHPYINTKTFLAVLFTLSPSSNNAKPTESTLRFAVAAGMVKVQPVKGEAKMNLDSLVEKLKRVCDENDRKIAEQKDVITGLQIDLEGAKQTAMLSTNSNEPMAVTVTQESERPVRDRGNSRRRRGPPNQMAGATLGRDGTLTNPNNPLTRSPSGHGRAESSLPMGLLAQLMSLDEPSDSSSEELDDMFAFEYDERDTADEDAVTAEMSAALARMNDVNESTNLIRSVLDIGGDGSGSTGDSAAQMEAAARATQATLAAGQQSIDMISGVGHEDDDADDEDEFADTFVDLNALDEDEIKKYADTSWIKIDETRLEQENLRHTQKTVVDHLLDTNEWLFNALKEVLDSSIGQ